MNININVPTPVGYGHKPQGIIKLPGAPEPTAAGLLSSWDTVSLTSNRATALGAISGAALGVLATSLPATVETAIVVALAVGGAASLVYPMLTSTASIGTPRWESGLMSLMTSGLFLGAPSAGLMVSRAPSFSLALSELGQLSALAILGGATGAVVGHMLFSDKSSHSRGL